MTQTDTESKSRKCSGADCSNDADSLQCPTCQKLGKTNFFCSQDCFKRNWTEHKKSHKSQGATTNPLHHFIAPKVISKPDPETGLYNPFPSYKFSGSLRPVYPLSPRRAVPESIKLPDYAHSGIPRSESLMSRHKIAVLDKKGQDAMKKVCRIGREILDIAASEVKPGVTTDHIDAVVHKATLERDAYPSPLNYNNFPKSVCTSVNEIICHGIPDQYVLKAGDIVNIDVSAYHGGYHGDLNETYYVTATGSSTTPPDYSDVDEDSIRVVETARECLAEAIKLVKPGMLFRHPGDVIEKHAKAQQCSVVRTYCGHGINTLFHAAPNVPHYAKNKAIGEAKPGMCFTIEPMITLGTWRDQTWPDHWTSSTTDGKRTAQFEHTLLVTEDGVEVLTARQEDSPGGSIPRREPKIEANGTTAD